jgi:AAA domain
MFKKASINQIKLRLALCGTSGAGKTFSSLAIASHLAQPIALIDTERGSASKYADIFDFDVCELTDFHPTRYIEAINAAVEAGYATIVIDSLSHAWYWELDAVDNQKNSFAAWKNIRPLERKLIDTIVGCRSHVIATMRSKTEWVIEQNALGKASPRKVGTTPVQTSSIEYEFDIAGEINQQHILTISKSRCAQLTDKTFLNPGREVAEILNEWLGQPWKNWTSENSAIDWAQKQLPTMPRDRVSARKFRH